MFLFGSRDVWFVVALPVYLGSVFGWDHLSVGSFMAVWVMGYGLVQSLAPRITGTARGTVPDGLSAIVWAVALSSVTAIVALAVSLGWHPEVTIVGGLLVFGAVFAVNSSLHSFLIVHYAGADGVSLDVGFYYMANAMGRLIGTILSGLVFQIAGLTACLWISVAFLALTSIISIGLPRHDTAPIGERNSGV